MPLIQLIIDHVTVGKTKPEDFRIEAGTTVFGIPVTVKITHFPSGDRKEIPINDVIG